MQNRKKLQKKETLALIPKKYLEYEVSQGGVVRGSTLAEAIHSQTINFQVLDKSPVSGPSRGPPSATLLFSVSPVSISVGLEQKDVQNYIVFSPFFIQIHHLFNFLVHSFQSLLHAKSL